MAPLFKVALSPFTFQEYIDKFASDGISGRFK